MKKNMDKIIYVESEENKGQQHRHEEQRRDGWHYYHEEEEKKQVDEIIVMIQRIRSRVVPKMLTWDKRQGTMLWTLIEKRERDLSRRDSMESL